jgi:hypothetical protein
MNAHTSRRRARMRMSSASRSQRPPNKKGVCAGSNQPTSCAITNDFGLRRRESRNVTPKNMRVRATDFAVRRESRSIDPLPMLSTYKEPSNAIV